MKGSAHKNIDYFINIHLSMDPSYCVNQDKVLNQRLYIQDFESRVHVVHKMRTVHMVT